MRHEYQYDYYYFWFIFCYPVMTMTGAEVGKTFTEPRDAALIAGVLVVVVLAGLLLLLWKVVHAPLMWVLVLAWLLLPLVPFVLRLLTLRFSPADREETDGLC